jgi:hypothetical protein
VLDTVIQIANFHSLFHIIYFKFTVISHFQLEVTISPAYRKSAQPVMIGTLSGVQVVMALETASPSES